MARTPNYNVQETEQGRTAVLTGDWIATSIVNQDSDLISLLTGSSDVTLDIRGIGRCDTAGAWAILKAAAARTTGQPILARPETSRLLELVDNAVKADPTPHVPRRGFTELLERIGKGVVNLAINATDTSIFLGHLLTAVGRAVMNPRRVRWASCVTLAERAGLDAMPIVATTSFFIGAVVGLLGANLLTQFGAQVFAVELIGIAVLREFGILITALLLAGRSASAFTAEIGAMKMNQEIDAMRVLGIDPFDALVFPRFVALLLTIPLLTFVATLSGLLGGLVVTWTVLDLGPAFFFQRMVDNVGVTHFWVGLSKAPVLAAGIAGIGCRQGMEVGGDVESLGSRVTASVVHAIFATILIDAVFALVYMQANI